MERVKSEKRAKLTPEQLKIVVAALAAMAVGQKGRRLRNASRRARGQEPEPGHGAGVKRHARYLKRTISTIKPNPDAHIHPRHKRAA